MTTLESGAVVLYRRFRPSVFFRESTAEENCLSLDIHSADRYLELSIIGARASQAKRCAG